MLYDKTPQYPHFSHLPFAKEPFKAIYVFQRLFSTLLLVPIWIIVNLPRSRRPRRSWSLRQVIFVNFTRRIYRVTEVAGVTWGTRNPEEEPKSKELKETRFEWAPPLKERYRAGVVVDRFGRVPCKRVCCFVWRQQVPNEDEIPVIGIFCHGGGYSQLSAHEKSRTSHIPRRLMKDRLFTEIYAVEYRLLQHAPLPAVIMDAAAAYAHVIEKYYGSDYIKPPEPPMRKPCKIVLLGDSSGGNLILALARWVRDEQLLPMPDGLLLFSPSCDTSHAFPSTQSSYIPRPNEDTDYLTDTPEPRALMQRTFLGFKYRPGGTGWGEWKRGRSRDGGDQLERHFYDGNGSVTKSVAATMAGAANASMVKLERGLKGAARSMSGRRVARSDIESQTLNAQSSFLASGPDESRTVAQEEDSDDKQRREQEEIEEETRSLMEIIHSEYVSPASPRVLRRWGHVVDLYDGGRIGDTPTENRDGAEIRTKDTLSPESSHPAKIRVWLTPTIVSEQYEWEVGGRSINTEQSQPSDSTNGSDSQNQNPVDMPEVHPTDFASAPAPENGSANTGRPTLRNQDTFTPRNPAHSYPSRYPQFHTLFTQFPKTFILIGDAERLTTEVGNLARAMGKDCDGGGGSSSSSGSVGVGMETGDGSVPSGKDSSSVNGKSSEDDLPKNGLVSLGNGWVHVRWTPDAVHDVFMIPPGWWDEKVKTEVWKDVKTWMRGFHEKKQTS